jgi:MFS family permease
MNKRHDKILFWGCFIALITTSYAFISRIILCTGTQFATEFSLDKVSIGELVGAGIWPFGVSIIVFSLFIDRIGYKVAMFFSFASYLIYTALAFAAYSSIHGVTGDALVAGQKHGYQMLYWGSIILGLGNGSVEAYINPIVTTMFNTDKTKWLNRLHAGWPGGLVLGGLCTIALAANPDWRITLGLILIPAFIFFFILVSLKFPKSEREQAGVSYLAMLKELGAFGALVGFGLVFAQLGQVFGWSSSEVWILTGVVVAVFVAINMSWNQILIGLVAIITICQMRSMPGFSGWIGWLLIGALVVVFATMTKSLGRGLLAIFIIIMIPQATTELGTDGWITSLMTVPMEAAKHNPAWVLVYTSAIMVVLRFSAGPLIHKLSPLGLLATCSALAALGLFALSKTSSAGMFTIFAAATLYGVGKTFFWPTILGLTSEQCPKGGALTLNAMGGIGMLAVGILGAPFIGYLQESSATKQLESANPALYQTVTVEKNYLLGAYKAIDPVKIATVSDDISKEQIQAATTTGQFNALGKMALFPIFMLACYLALIFYFKSKGGYKPVQLGEASAGGGK